ncbi:DUF4935 domain-containing protein [Microvirga sp. BT688]|uniref:PIN domain-containing protein n=1 Tax=Microvirga sp. TaxID=1873136 RepID=UPI001686444B|nr:PIN domain-containing protein [Microvirga sp.]MBD2749171.1 DUF4935 domain-containing protein [Microvirga sp.]
MKQYQDVTGYEVIDPKNVAVADLVRMYFEPTPPFEKSEAKKAEFPDAIALISLADFAKARGMKVLAISKDSGWKRFADSSEHIDVTDDLSKALAAFQEHTEQARKFVEQLLSCLARGERPDLKEQISHAIEGDIDAWVPYPDASVPFDWEISQVDLVLADVTLNPDDFDLVNLGREEVVAKVGVELEIKAEVSYALSIRDPFDGDYVSLGGGSVEVPVRFQASVLLTLIGPVTETLEEIDVDRAELVNLPNSIELGDLDIYRLDNE